MIRVLLVDDQALIRVGFRTILESEPGIEVVGEAANGEEGITMAQELAPDVICMDVQMPKLDGIAATRRLTQENCRSTNSGTSKIRTCLPHPGVSTHPPV